MLKQNITYTAFITGAAKRIGKEIALSLAKSGYNIALHFNNSLNEAKILQSEIKNLNVKCEIFQCDFSKESEVLKLIKNAYEVFPYINTLINSASIFEKSTILQTKTSLFDDIFNVNFKAPFILSKEFALHSKKGNIINLLDTKINKNGNSYAAYTLSKKLLKDFTLMSAKEFAPEIRVNGIAPGFILPPDDANKGYINSNAINIPLNTTGNISYITDAVDFLLNNNYITGQIIYIDGGQHL
jgi:pteridine reductase